jgi:mycothiol synthase
MLPDGISLRRGERGDVDAVTDLLIAEEVELRGHSGWDAADTADWWHGLELHGESWVAVDDRTIAGVLGLFTRGHCDGWFSVHPGFRGCGLEAGLVEHAEARAGDLGTDSLMLNAFSENELAQKVLGGAGYRIVRRFYRMQIELDPKPPEPAWPAGIDCSTFDVAEARALHAASHEAFSENWGSHPIPFEDWKRRRLAAPDFDPSLWFIAHDDGEIAGFARCEPRRWGGGWVAALGVRRPWRQRGLGLALLLQSFRAFHERGENRVGLGVDSANETGATRLYERAGMRVVAEDVVWRKELV